MRGEIIILRASCGFQRGARISNPLTKVNYINSWLLLFIFDITIFMFTCFQYTLNIVDFYLPIILCSLLYKITTPGSLPGGINPPPHPLLQPKSVINYPQGFPFLSPYNLDDHSWREAECCFKILQLLTRSLFIQLNK